MSLAGHEGRPPCHRVAAGRARLHERLLEPLGDRRGPGRPGRGRGGKYLLLPPGYDGDVPDGYFVLRSRTYGNALSSAASWRTVTCGRRSRARRQHYRVYPLDRADDPPAMDFVDVSGQLHEHDRRQPTRRSSTTSRRWCTRSRSRRSTRRPAACSPPIGIRKDAPFAPDARMQGDPGRGRRGRQRHGARHPLQPPRPAAATTTRTAAGRWGTMRRRHRVLARRRARPRRAHVLLLAHRPDQPGDVGEDGRRRLAVRRRRRTTQRGRYLDGGRTYRLHLPPDIPVKDFWSVHVYDPQTRSMLQTDQRFPMVGSQRPGLRP